MHVTMEHDPNLGLTALMIYLNWMSSGGIQRIMWARWERLVEIALRYLARLRRQSVFDSWARWNTHGWGQLPRRGPPGF